MSRLFLFSTVFLLLAFFGSVLLGTDQFAFRDGAHFYYPLYRYIQEELAVGRLPLWIPYESLGQPLAGNPAAGLFYPGKLLFFLPCDFTTLYHWFIVLHVFGAAATMYRLIRFYGKSDAASTFAAIVYAFGGSVVYQHLNVIFLIGATWFPELIRLTLRQRQMQHQKTRLSCGSSIVIAMMILGGDVQAAYHAGLAVLFLLGPKKSVGPLLLAFLLAAVQILPAWELARSSHRTQTGVPRSVWQTPFAKDADAVLDGLFCRDFEQRGHAKTAYNFSVAPWRLAEMIWPNFGGKQFPENTRWFSANSYDKFVWVPSLYCGVIALIFAIAGSFQRRFPALIFLVLVVGSFGSFGIGWLFHRPNLAGDPVGGIYWLMNLLLPGYAQFRYPAKLLTTAAIPLAILVAYGFDQVFSDPKKIPNSVFLPTFSVLFISMTLLAVLSGTSLWNSATENVPNCPMFGPFQADSVKSVVVHSLLHTIVVLTLFIGILLERGRLARIIQVKCLHSPGADGTPAIHVFLVVLCCFDLYLANRWMIPTADRRNFARPSTLLEKIAETHQGPQPPRIYRYSIWYPPQFRNQTSANRFAESVVFDQETLWPKYSLQHRVSVVDVQGTMSIQSYEKKLKEIRSSVREFENRVSRLGVEYVILPINRTLNHREAVKLYSDPANDAALWKLRQPGPTAWISSGTGSAQIVSYEPNRIVVAVETEGDSPQSQTLVLAEQYWPGWKAQITSEQSSYSTKIFPVDEIFRGLEIPSGKCRVTFYFDPFLLKLGAIGTLFAWIFVATILLRASFLCEKNRHF